MLKFKGAKREQDNCEYILGRNGKVVYCQVVIQEIFKVVVCETTEME